MQGFNFVIPCSNMRGFMKKVFLIITFGLCNLFAWATHNRAGEITYTHITGFTYQITITTYTKLSQQQADRSSLNMIWGDGTSDTIDRKSVV